ncbi:MAG TPA: hypothetical protein VHF22_14440 [Planctomycetota bacterium]|nr:hypothetical protein [Planctomycetota bacterium]
MNPLERWRAIPAEIRTDVIDDLRKTIQALRGAAADTAKEAARADTINLFEATAGAADDLHKKADAMEVAAELLEAIEEE